MEFLRWTQHQQGPRERQPQIRPSPPQLSLPFGQSSQGRIRRREQEESDLVPSNPGQAQQLHLRITRSLRYLPKHPRQEQHPLRT